MATYSLIFANRKLKLRQLEGESDDYIKVLNDAFQWVKKSASNGQKKKRKDTEDLITKIADEMNDYQFRAPKMIIHPGSPTVLIDEYSIKKLFK